MDSHRLHSANTVWSAAFLRLTMIALLATPAVFSQPQPAADRLATNAQRSTPDGATFTAPEGWSIRSGASSVILDAPEGDSHVAIIDVRATDAAAAVAEAWTAYRPEAKRPLKLATPMPGRNGWEERRIFNYETSPNERAALQAIALRGASRARGEQWRSTRVPRYNLRP